jgi:hypothetical protein
MKLLRNLELDATSLVTGLAITVLFKIKVLDSWTELP